MKILSFFLFLFIQFSTQRYAYHPHFILFEVHNPYPWPINFNWLSTPFYDKGNLHVEKDGERIGFGRVGKARGFHVVEADPKLHLQSLLPLQSISMAFDLARRIDMRIPGVYTIKWVPECESNAQTLETELTELKFVKDEFDEMNYERKNYAAYFFPVYDLKATNIITIDVRD